MTHFTPFTSVKEIADLYASNDAPDYAADGCPNLPVNLSPQQKRNIKQLSLSTGAPIAWLIRHAAELVYGEVLQGIERRYE